MFKTLNYFSNSVEVLLKGGLGNQMFQYAAGHAFSRRIGAQLNIDISFLDCNKIENDHFTPREFELDSFFGKLNNQPSSIKNIFFQRVSNSNFFSKFSIKKALGCNFILDDYFQGEFYFLNYSEEIKKLFSFNLTLLDQQSLFLYKILKSKNSIGVHVRRGDYLKHVNKRHGICPIAYYTKAFHLIKKKVEKPFFVIFSDDPFLAESELSVYLDDYIVVNANNPKRPWVDMCLMSNCHSNIIANSTYSWWGAYLNQNFNKVIIAPAKWYSDPIDNLKFSDILPKSWFKIHV
jgi:hypothetical protein